MRKNGFTLVEMMTVIIIMVTLGIIAVFSITGIVKNSTDKLYQLQINSILDASRTYAVKNNNILSDNNEITICDLKRSSLLESDLKNPKTEEQFDNSLIIKIVRNSDGEFDFSFDGTSKMENYYCDLDVTVTINGDSPLYVKLGENHNEQGIMVKRKDLSCTKRVGSAQSNATNCYYDLRTEGDYSSAITDNKYSKVGTFKETYVVTDEKFSSTITRTIVVQDKTPPTIRVSYGGTTYNDSFSIRVVEGTNVNFSCSATDNSGESIFCETVKDNYSGTTEPGTYEMVYNAKDSSGNSASLLVSITVLSKNKKLIVGSQVSTLDWTNESVTLKIIPLYSSENCGGYSYTFDGFFWNDTNTKVVTENGNYKMGIKCNRDGTEDYMIYKVSNIDKVSPTFDSGGSVVVTQDVGEFAESTKNGKNYYYSNGSVLINQPSGANDLGSGVARYEIYANDQILNSDSLSGDGKYEIKIAAYDHSENKSDLKTVAYVIISSMKPSCEFIRCDTPRECNTKNPISGPYITYSGQYKLTTSDFSTPIPISFRLSCTYEYFDGEEDIYESLNLPKNKFYLMEESGDMDRIDVTNVVNNISESETSCNNGKCTKTNYYTATINSYGIYNTTYFYLRENALCDRVKNCNMWQVVSMDLWP